jgi:uncharacterized protein
MIALWLYAIGMGYEYDDEKSARTLRERGIDFEFAARLFDGDFIEYEDQRAAYGETRHVAIGPIDHMLFAVVYSWRGARRRIISARRASRRERRAYHQALRQAAAEAGPG